MNNEQISINPTTVTIFNIAIEINMLVLNLFVELRVLQSTSTGALHKVDNIRIEGDDYKNSGK